MRFFIIFSLLIFSPALWAAEKENGFVYDDHSKRDPFWNLVTPVGVVMNYDSDVQISDLTLAGIISGKDGGNLAIINNRIVKANDRIGPFVVDKIEQDKVFLINGQQSFELKIKKGGLEDGY